MLEKLIERHVNRPRQLHHGVNADIVHRIFHLGNMSLRNSSLLGEIALTKTSSNPGAPKISRKNLTLPPDY